MTTNDSVLQLAAELREKDAPFALVTVVRCESPTSAKPGDKAVVDSEGAIHGWIGGGCAQPVVTKAALRALAEERPCLVRISPHREADGAQGIVHVVMACHSGGTLDIFIDPIKPQPELLIIGVTPVAQALCALASRVGFAVSAAGEGAAPDMFVDAKRVIDGPALSQAKPKPRFVAVATQGEKDEEGLEAALATGAPYIAFVASERKAAKMKQYLRERGHAAERVEAIVSPAGIPINAATPEEIALSLLAALVRERRASYRRPDELSTPQPADADDLEAPAQPTAVDPICGMAVDPAGAQYAAAREGRTWYFCSAHCLHAFEQAADSVSTARRAK
jgi:xanthine dehydrogenase accessory factor